MKTNRAVKNPPVATHEGGKATNINAEQMLRRSVMSCLLWENEFYEDGVTIAQRIADLVPQVSPHRVGNIALTARSEMKLRHAPLFLVREMARYIAYRPFVEDALPKVIQRADELAEFMAMYWKEGKVPVAHSVRRGLDKALRNFNEYELAKYDRAGKVTLRDVFRIIRPKPENEEQKALWGRAVKGELATPDTWEVALSKNDGVLKKVKWERLLSENKLGALALLRNLRNMTQEGVDPGLIKDAIARSNVSRVLPFRFIAAARYAPRLEPELEDKMFESIGDKKFLGKTVILVDISGSMTQLLSEKSDLRRLDAAYGVAMVGREMYHDVEVWSFSNGPVFVPPRRGFALRDAIDKSQSHSSTEMGKAVAHVDEKVRPDRIIVITDEQTQDRVNVPKATYKYVINVASARNGIGYGEWTHIDGFSEAVFNYIAEVEKVRL